MTPLDPLPGKGSPEEQARWRAERRASDSELAPFGMGGASAVEITLRRQIAIALQWAADHDETDPGRAASERARADQLRQILVSAGLMP
jgi:hypothetical protein